MVTGSVSYPGAALLGTAAAARTGVGMVRYVGPRAVTSMVILRHPEIVAGTGRVQAWVVGSGVPAGKTDSQRGSIAEAFASGEPIVVDAGAIPDALAVTHLDLNESHPFIFTPHAGELAALLTELGYPTRRDNVEQDPGEYASVTAGLLGATVLVKGARTFIANETGSFLVVPGGPAWLATAGTGDVLAGVIGGLVATASARLGEVDSDARAGIAATGVFVHAEAGRRASAATGGPIVASDLLDQIPRVIADLCG